MSNNHARNVNGLLSHAKTKSESVKQRIDSAIESLMRENMAVNFNSVAARACVSKTTLYNHPEYRVQIQSLRCNYNSAKRPIKPTVTDKGKDIIIAAKNKRIHELQEEVNRLSSILKRFYAKEYEKY